MATDETNPFWVNMLPASLRGKLSGRKNLFAMLHNSGWLLFEKFFRLTLAMLVSAWVARYLGPSQFGELAYALAYIGFFSAIANLGMDGIIVRDISKNETSAPQILGTAFVLRLAAGASCWAIAIASMLCMGDFHSAWIIALAGGSLAFQSADTADLWFQSKSQSKRTVIVKLASYLIASCIKIALILYQAPVEAFAFVFTLDALIAAIGLYIAYKRFPAGGLWKNSFKTGKQLLKESWPYALSGLAINIYMRIDQVMIKNILGTKEVGIFAAAVPISQIWNLIPLTLVTSLAPFVARKKAESHAAYMEALLKIFRLFLTISLITCTITVFLSDFAVHLLYGNKYNEAASVLSIHVFSNIFVFLGVAQSLWLVNEGKGKLNLIQTVLGAATAIIGNLWAIPRYGVQGAAAVVIISQALSAVLSNLFFAPQIFFMQLGIRVKSNHT